MADKKILLIGRGHLGSFLKKRLSVPDELHWTKEMAEVDEALLNDLKPDAVVNTAGKTELSWCEENPLETFRCNVTAPIQIGRAIRAALGKSATFIHISSGCVWDGPYKEDGTAFEPNDAPKPACFYSWTKASCDALMLREAEGYPLVLLRPRQVYSPLPSPRNTLGKLGRYPGLIDTPNSMTSAETIAKTIEQALDPESGSKGHGRIINVYEPGLTSPYKVGSLMAEAGLREKPTLMTKDDLDLTLVPKRVDTVLHDGFFEAWVNPPEIEAELKSVIAAYGKALAVEK